jgi:hypothetical protein
MPSKDDKALKFAAHLLACACIEDGNVCPLPASVDLCPFEKDGTETLCLQHETNLPGNLPGLWLDFLIDYAENPAKYTHRKGAKHDGQ